MKKKQGIRLPPYVMLMLVSVVMSFAIAGVYAVTKDTIEAAAEAAQAAARTAVMTEAAAMTELPLEEGAPVDSCYEAFDGAGEPMGWVSQITVVGFGGEIQVTVGLDRTGAITGVSVGGKDFSETSGLGAKTREPAFTDQFAGKSGMLVLKQDIDSVTGASISSGAVVSGVNKAVAYMTGLLPAADAAGAEEIPLTEEQLAALGVTDPVWMGGGRGINGWWRTEEGYLVRATGFGEGPIAVLMAFDHDGVVTGLVIGDENFMETEGRGDGVLADWYRQQFIGRSGAQAYGQGIDAISGATVTSDATLAAINACMSFDPADPGTAEENALISGEPSADGVTRATEPAPGSAEPDPNPPVPDGVTEASVPAEETAPAADTSGEPGGVTEATVEAEEMVSEPASSDMPAEPAAPDPDSVTAASIPAEEAPAETPAPLGEPILPAPAQPGRPLVTPSPTLPPVPAPDAVTEASIPEEETPSVTPPPLGVPIGGAADAVTEATAAE